MDAVTAEDRPAEAAARAWRAYLLLGVLLIGAYFLLPAKSARGITFELIGASGVAAVVAGVRIHRPRRPLPWYCLAAGAALFVAGDATWDLYELVLHVDPFPSVADGFYLSGYVPLIAGLGLLVRRRTTAGDRAGLIDATIVATGLGILAWIYLVNPQATDPELSIAGRLIAISYPIMDVALAGLVARLLVGAGARTASYRFLAAAVAGQLFADALFALMELAGTYETGHPIDAGWLLFFVLLGTAALHPSMRTLLQPDPAWESRLTWGRLGLVGSASLLAPVALTLEVVRGGERATTATVMGSAALLLLVLARINERKQTEDALRRALRREREASERLRALSELKSSFLTTVSHELRTPLTSVVGYAVTLEKRGDDLPAEVRSDAVRRLATNARKLERLVLDLLDLDRLGRGALKPELAPADVGKLVSRVVEESDLGGRPVEVEAEPVVAAVDARKVERIADYLLANTAKHTPPGTRVWVRVRPSGDGVLIAVDDEGPGVPEELKKAIFEPFRHGASDGTSPGAGIGLSLVAELARAHGGRAWVGDRPGGGASFRVYLPGAPGGPASS